MTQNFRGFWRRKNKTRKNKMEEHKVSGIREGEEIFISYKDDNEQIVSGFVVLISISETLITFKTNQNTITIPVSRLIKIKQRKEWANYLF